MPRTTPDLLRECAELAAALSHCRADWLPKYAPAGKIEGGVFLLGDAEGSPGRSLPVPLKPNGRPLVDFAAGPVGNDVDLLQRLTGWPLGEAVREARQILGLEARTLGRAPQRPARAVPQAIEREPEPPRDALPAALRLYARAEPILPGTLAATYLAGRRCALPHLDGDLRQLARHRHPIIKDHVGPALVALVTDAVTAAPMSLHLTWLAADGSGKAELGKLQRTTHAGLPIGGGVVRVWPDDCVTYGLLVAEGIETTLTAAIGFQPAWSCINAGNLRRFPVLDGIGCLTVVLDHDRHNERTGKQPGMEAGRACIARWLAAGREARPCVPEVMGDDLNDEAQR